MVFTASLSDFVCRKSKICFRDVQMGFSPLSLHQLTKLSHLALYTVLAVSLVAARIVLIADSENLYPGENTAQLPHSQPEGLQVGVEEHAFIGRCCDRKSLLHGSRRGISHAIWRRWYQDLLGKLGAMTMNSSA